VRRTGPLLIGLLALVLVVGFGVVGAKVLTSGWVYDAPLPGGADVGSDPMTLSADFADVLDLVPQSSVKVDNVAVGRVSSIDLNADGRSARVTLTVNGSVSLPAGTTARLQQTSLLGEKYVALIRPTTATDSAATATTASLEPLHDGSQIGMADTSAAADVEQVLGALSMVLNGGGVGQFQEISRELQAVSTGRPGEIRGFLDQLQRFVKTLDDKKSSITSALDGLAALSARLDADKTKITRALDGLSPGMQVLVDQRKQLTAMLASLDRLGEVTVKTLDASQKDIVADFKALDPILTQLAKAGSDLPASLQILLTYPFPDSVLGAVKGDYLNTFVTTNFRTLPTGCAAQGCAWPQVSGAAAGRSRASAASAPPALLPPTSSPVAGATTSAVPAPSLLPSVTAAPTGSSNSSPTLSPTASSSASLPSSSAESTSGAPAVTDSPSGSPSGSPSSPTSTTTSGSTSEGEQP
jgi:phospholipid/cholesterol/gamma-HCH transport system substrate-binding protein